MNEETPLYLLIALDLQNEILSGRLAPGQQFPSIRQLAGRYHVTANTVQHAIYKLQTENLLAPYSRKGHYVTFDLVWIRQCRSKKTEELVQAFQTKMKGLGYTVEDIVNILRGLPAHSKEIL